LDRPYRIGILNVSSGMVRLDEGGEWDEYTFTVLDSSGKSVPLTERGKKESDRAATRTAPNPPFSFSYRVGPAQGV